MTETIERLDFQDLFVLDLANNHQGSVVHGKDIIERCADVAARQKVRAAIKFQFRDLDTFVHAGSRSGALNKHIDRFLSTRLSWEEFRSLLDVVRCRGLVPMCTPFDEASVEWIERMGFDVVKVASCSARDYPLLERVAASGLPIVASTGGLNQDEVDDLVSFFEHRACDFALMHCVSIYPTPDAACELGAITAFRIRYPNRAIGWSTHENPSDMVPVGIAAGLGASIFERHVGLPTETIKLNSYSSTPDQVDQWIGAWKKAKILIGHGNRGQPLAEERHAIDELRRGVYARRRLEAGQTIARDDIYFAFPYTPGSLTSGEWKDGIVATGDIAPDSALDLGVLNVPGDPDAKIIKDAVHEVKGLLNLANVPLTTEFTVEYSHHYGVQNFRKIGAVLINVINREYCKKVLVQLPGQVHPWHFHKRKEETFLVLWGKLHVDLDGRHKVLERGDTLLVQPGVWHRFWTEDGCVFEEISTTHFADDSVYRDEGINKLTSNQRKTVVDHWGRFQLIDQLRAAEIAAE